MVKMVTILGIVFFVSCTLSLTQGQSPKNEEYRKFLLPRDQKVLNARLESYDMPMSTIPSEELLDSSDDTTIPYDVLASLVG